MIKDYLALWKQLTASGTVKPTTHLLEKEASEDIESRQRSELGIN
jgi:hypothetical protein